MILFPNAKINIGLRVLRRRPDGYHDIESIFVPLPWCDVLEIVESENGQGSFNIIGEDILRLADDSDNLVMKAVRALECHIGRPLPPLDIYLSKRIPTGAGLGGGSADASFTIKGINELLGLGLDDATMASIASKVGADCPFFIYNRPMLVRGTGDIMSAVEAPELDKLYVVAAKIAGTEVSTREAYAGVTPREMTEGTDFAEAIRQEPGQWTGLGLTNDFEESVFPRQPLVKELKERLAEPSCGCDYCLMSGSGSTVYGLFRSASAAENCAAALRQTYPGADIFSGRLSSHPVV